MIFLYKELLLIFINNSMSMGIYDLLLVEMIGIIIWFIFIFFNDIM